jgi:hypothetical protein
MPRNEEATEELPADLAWDEYKLLQDKIDRIGDFRFRVKQWLALFPAALVAGFDKINPEHWWLLLSVSVFFVAFYVLELDQSVYERGYLHRLEAIDIVLSGRKQFVQPTEIRARHKAKADKPAPPGRWAWFSVAWAKLRPSKRPIPPRDFPKTPMQAVDRAPWAWFPLGRPTAFFYAAQIAFAVALALAKCSTIPAASPPASQPTVTSPAKAEESSHDGATGSSHDGGVRDVTLSDTSLGDGGITEDGGADE